MKVVLVALLVSSCSVIHKQADETFICKCIYRSERQQFFKGYKTQFLTPNGDTLTLYPVYKFEVGQCYKLSY